MKKISTLYKKDFNNLSRVINEINPENLTGCRLIKHGCEVLPISDFSFDELKNYLSNPELNIEGIVFHHKTDGRMCKIRKRDFGFKRRLL